MKNKYLVIPGSFELKESPYVDFLFPLKGFCVGFLKDYDITEIPNKSYVYLNRVLTNEDLEKLAIILDEKPKIKGLVFEDLGILELTREKNLDVEMIFYATHASCSSYSINTYLKFVDSVVISPDITFDEIKEILNNVSKKVCLYTYGPLPYLYSKRKLLTNYQKNFQLAFSNYEIIEEESTHKKFMLIENEYGTVCYDTMNFDGRAILNSPNVLYYILNLSLVRIDDFTSWLTYFEDGVELSDTTSGFLDKKTIYKLPPRKE